MVGWAADIQQSTLQVGGKVSVPPKLLDDSAPIILPLQTDIYRMKEIETQMEEILESNMKGKEKVE